MKPTLILSALLTLALGAETANKKPQDGKPQDVKLKDMKPLQQDGKPKVAKPQHQQQQQQQQGRDRKFSVSHHRDMPKCASACLRRSASITSGCKPNNTACFCQNFDKILKNTRTCSERKCGMKAHARKVIPAAIAMCISQENETPPGALFEMAMFRHHESLQLVEEKDKKNPAGGGPVQPTPVGSVSIEEPAQEEATNDET